jgi:3-oxoacyl-[acyl-carrier protein] reductase
MRKLALVTGASGGIGEQIAGMFAREGYDLVLTGHMRRAALEGIGAALSAKYGVECRCCCGDISSEGFVDRIFEGVDELDVLINNAGISCYSLLQDMSLDQWDRVMAVNLTSVFLTCRRAVPLMLGKKSGSIINISSMWGSCGAAMEVAYSASKGGLNTMTRALAKELAPSGIQVNALACGVVDTRMNSFLTEEERSELCSQIPAGRFASCEEVAQAVASIIKAGPYMTGQVIGMDGGFI